MVKAQIGRGTFGRVWLATDRNQGRDVALKTFGPRSPAVRAYTEATALTALEGEHVLRVYNADTSDDIPYLATRVARLGSTEDVLKVNPLGIPPDIVVSWIRQALVGMGACHASGLVHRDVKPGNVFLDSDELALLGDFGLVHRIDALGQVPAEGTVLTMAPEMWEHGKGDTRSDLYSMGVTVYRLLTGKWPIEADTVEELKGLVLAGTYEPLRDAAPHVSRRLASRVERAMARAPQDRYQDWREMHDDLGRPGVVAGVWRPSTPHAGHDACWTEVRRASGLLHSVCVMPDGARTFEVETRRTAGAKTRVGDHCHSGVPRSRLPTVLRRAFDNL